MKYFSLFRYNPPEPEDNEKILYRILQMFHKRPFLLNRFGPHGTSCVLRATSESYFDVYCRIHAEYQLNEPPYFPFWFTPAQFNLRIIINRNLNHIEYLRVYLPTEKALNIGKIYKKKTVLTMLFYGKK